MMSKRNSTKEENPIKIKCQNNLVRINLYRFVLYKRLKIFKIDYENMKDKLPP